MIKNLVYLLFLTLISIHLIACGTAPKKVSIPPVTPTTPPPRMEMLHTVGPGETMWRISKMYDVPIDTIMSSNQLSNSQNLKMGQKLRIPNAAQIKPVITLYPSKRWEYIIIHHSGTEEGSALQFHRSHLNKGWDKGVGYHFVIDNAESDKQDGQIESTPRWIKQEDGAHCKAADMNIRGIGICLVGNFDEDQISRKQMDSLITLVNKLRRHYNIPFNRIMGHGNVSGASTHCPGTRFPWDEFMARLKSAPQD